MMDLADPEALGFNPARLARIGAFLEERYVGPGRLPHADLLLARGGQPFYRVTLGQARADGTPLQDDAIYRIASMTKALTSAAFMMLLEEGKVALDDPVTRVIPEFAGLGVYTGGGGDAPFAPARPAMSVMRMVDLLTHMSGLTYGIQNRTNVDAAYRKARLDGHPSLASNDHFITELAKLPLEFDPGTGWNYSVGTDVLGVIVARLSGMNLGEFLQSRIFAPLGMVDTGFHVRDGQGHRLAGCYQPSRTGGIDLQDDAATSSFLKPAEFISGGGGLVSTASDYMKFAQMLLNGGTADGHRYISRKTLDLMTANHLPGNGSIASMSKSLFSEAAYDGIGFGLGFATTMQSSRTLMPGSDGDYFWGGAASTFFWIDPEEDLIGLFMTQLMPSSTYPVRREVRTMVYAALDD